MRKKEIDYSENTEEVEKSTLQGDDRTYSFEVKETVKGKKYIEITDYWKFKGEEKSSRLRIFQEDIRQFAEMLSNVIKEVYPLCEALSEIIPKKKVKHVFDRPQAGLKWTEEEENKLKDLLSQGYTEEQLSTALGRSRRAIWLRLEKLGLLKY